MNTNDEKRATSKLKNPTRWLNREIRRISGSVTRATANLREAAIGVKEAVHKIVEADPPLFFEILVLGIHRLILTAIESAIDWFLRRIAKRPKPALVFTLRPPDPAT